MSAFLRVRCRRDAVRRKVDAGGVTLPLMIVATVGYVALLAGVSFLWLAAAPEQYPVTNNAYVADSEDQKSPLTPNRDGADVRLTDYLSEVVATPFRFGLTTIVVGLTVLYAIVICALFCLRLRE